MDRRPDIGSIAQLFAFAAPLRKQRAQWLDFGSTDANR
jgi:hypothetical protein